MGKQNKDQQMVMEQVVEPTKTEKATKTKKPNSNKNKGKSTAKRTVDKKLTLEEQFKTILKKIPEEFHLPVQFTNFYLAKDALGGNLLKVYCYMRDFVLTDVNKTPDGVEAVGHYGEDFSSTYSEFVGYCLKQHAYEAFIAIRYFATYDAALRAILRGKLAGLTASRVAKIRTMNFSDLGFNSYSDLCMWLQRAPSLTSNVDYFWSNFVYYMKGGKKNGVVLK